MKLIAGLGNPGPKYAGTRHNVGFRVLDTVARRWSVDVSGYEKKFEALAGVGPVARAEALLLKPQTFMNLSGQSVGAAARFYKIERQDVLVIYDELDLPPGAVKVRAQGSPGGHKGMRDVIRHLGGEDVPRVRVGIGKVDRTATVEYVLSGFRPDERELVDEAVELAADAVEVWLRRGIDAAMNETNRRGASPGGGAAGAAEERPPRAAK